MEVICQIFLDMLHILKFYLICNYFFNFKKRHVRYGIAFILVMIAFVSVIVLFYGGTALSFFSYSLCVFVILIILYEERKGLLCVVGMWSMISISLIDLMSSALIGILFKLTKMGKDNLEELLIHLITLLFLFITGHLMRKRSERSLKHIGIPYLVIFTFLTLADAVVLTILGEFVLKSIEENHLTKLGFVFIVIILGLFLQLLMVLLLMLSRDSHKEKEKLAQRYLAEQIEHYQYLELREHETKKFRHDLRNHMHILSTLYQKKEYAQMEEYLSELGGKIDSFSNTISVNHGIVDAILNKYFVEANKHMQTLLVKGHFPMECRIGAYDLCTIFSNLLSNACEAAPQDTTIEVEVRHVDEDIMIIVGNEYMGELDVENGEFKTTKKDKLSHGLGLENVKECIRRNGGQMDVVTENQRFVVTVLLKNRGNENEDSSSR